MSSSRQVKESQAKHAAKVLPTAVPQPWKSTLQHLRAGNRRLTKADIFSCLCFFERPESWVFFIVDEGASMPPVVNLQLYRHVVFAVMMDHWVVVHVDLVNLKAAFLDPKSSPTSIHPAYLRELLVKWLEQHLDHGKIDKNLQLYEKECEQHDDTSMLAILNIVSLARGYPSAVGGDPARLRVKLIHKMNGMRYTNKPSTRLNQWANYNGLRTANSLFSGRVQPQIPSDASSVSSDEIGEHNEPTSLWGWLTGSPAAPNPHTTTSAKRKLDTSSAATEAPAKRRHVEYATEEQNSSCLSAWWGKDMDLDAALKSTEQLRRELRKAEADIQAIKAKLGKIEQIIGRS